MTLIIKYLFYFVLLCCLINVCVSQNKNIGDPCQLPILGTGVCKKISECPKAREQHAIGIKPNICNRKAGVVVCCEGTSSTPPIPRPQIIAATTRPPQITTIPPQTTTRRPSARPPQFLAKSSLGANSFIPPISIHLRKSQQKCLQYSAPVQTTIYTVPLSIDRTVIPQHINTCVFHSKTLIYGGSLAEYGEFPHMALLGNGRQWFCGGSLISEQYVLTAAHCFQTRIGPLNVVRLGDLNLKKSELNSEPEDIPIEKFIIYEDYVPSKVYNDIALVKLSRNATFSNYIRPACLWNQYSIIQDNATATGWGAIEQGVTSDDLLKVNLNIVDQESCKNLYKNYTSPRLGAIKRNIVCASSDRGGDTCQGDSGGPLEITNPDNKCIHYIIGVTSAGRGCGSSLPGIYTRVSHFIDWIEEVVWP